MTFFWSLLPAVAETFNSALPFRLGSISPLSSACRLNHFLGLFSRLGYLQLVPHFN